MQVRRLILLPIAALLLSGCVAGMVAGAASMAAGSGGERRNNEFMQAAARQACTAHALQYGAVQVVSVTQAKNAVEIVVSGTVADAGGGKNSFECSFVTEITGFALRRIQPGT